MADSRGASWFTYLNTSSRHVQSDVDDPFLDLKGHHIYWKILFNYWTSHALATALPKLLEIGAGCVNWSRSYQAIKVKTVHPDDITDTTLDKEDQVFAWNAFRAQYVYFTILIWPGIRSLGPERVRLESYWNHRQLVACRSNSPSLPSIWPSTTMASPTYWTRDQANQSQLKNQLTKSHKSSLPPIGRAKLVLCKIG